MSDQPILISSGLPTTVLPEPDRSQRDALADALDAADPKAEIAAIVAANPRSLEAWATFGDHCGDVMSR